MEFTATFPEQWGIFLTLPLIGGALYILVQLRSVKHGKFPSINGRQGCEVSYANSRRRFLLEAGALIKSGFQKVSNRQPKISRTITCLMLT